MPGVERGSSARALKVLASRLLTCSLAPGLVVLALLPQTAGAYCPLSTENPMPVSGGECEPEGIPLSWHKPCVSYSLVYRERGPLSFEDVRDIVDLSFQTWTEARCGAADVALEIRQTEALSECSEAEHNSSGGNVNTVAFVSKWKEEKLDPNAFALTKVWHDSATGEIVGVDMLLNENMGTFDDCRERRCPGGEVDLENVVTHEAGHFLGLGHSDDPDASMYFEAERGEVKKRHLEHDDEAGLCSLYGPADSDKLCSDVRDFRPPGGFEPICDPPVQTGCRCNLAGTHTTPGGLYLLAGLMLARLTRRKRGQLN